MLICKIILACFFAIIDTCQSDFIYVILRSASRELEIFGVGKLLKARVGNGFELFTSNSATLVAST